MYPELERVKRRKDGDSTNKPKTIPKLYLITGDKKKEIKPTKKREKKLSQSQKKAISRWAYITTSDLTKNINTSHFAKYEKNTNIWKKNKCH